jgi:hypothetical protein
LTQSLRVNTLETDGPDICAATLVETVPLEVDALAQCAHSVHDCGTKTSFELHSGTTCMQMMQPLLESPELDDPPPIGSVGLGNFAFQTPVKFLFNARATPPLEPVEETTVQGSLTKTNSLHLPSIQENFSKVPPRGQVPRGQSLSLAQANAPEPLEEETTSPELLDEETTSPELLELDTILPELLEELEVATSPELLEELLLEVVV